MEAPAVATVEEPKKARASRLLSFLSCCGVFERANSLDVDGPEVPPKKSTKLRPVHGRLSTPVNRSDGSAQESSTAESKDPIDEKVAGLQDADKNGSAQEPNEPNHGEDQTEKSKRDSK